MKCPDVLPTEGHWGFLNTVQSTERKKSSLKSPPAPPKAKVPLVSNRIEKKIIVLTKETSVEKLLGNWNRRVFLTFRFFL